MIWGRASWSLQFAFPSARVERVWGALWRPSGNGDGGTATGPWQWHGKRGQRRLQDRQMMVPAAGAPAARRVHAQRGQLQFGR